MAHDTEKQLLNFWNKEQVIALAGDYDPLKLKAFLREASGRIDKVKKSLSVVFENPASENVNQDY